MNNVEYNISVNKNTWVGSYKLCPNCKTTRQKGIIRDGKLYIQEDLVYVPIGDINNNSITTTVNRQKITLTK